VESKGRRIRHVKKRWKNLCVIAVIILLASGSAYPQEPRETKEIGRYVLLSATVVVTVTESKPKPQAASEKVPVVLKIDTVTGKTWQLDIGVINGKSIHYWNAIDEE
jgi:hypothetical protein